MFQLQDLMKQRLNGLQTSSNLVPSTEASKVERQFGLCPLASFLGTKPNTVECPAISNLVPFGVAFPGINILKKMLSQELQEDVKAERNEERWMKGQEDVHQKIGFFYPLHP